MTNSSFQEWAGDRRLKGLVFLVLLLAALALGAYTYLSLKQAKYVYGSPTTISVRGVGEVLKVPDIATFSFNVHAEDKGPSSAQTRSAEAANAIISYLKQNGVAETDIKTLNYNLSPRYEYMAVPCRTGFCPPGNSKIAGYNVDETIQVKVRDTKKAGDLLAGVGSHGAKDISGLTFTIDDDKNAKAEARTKAVADAKDKAKQLADTLSVRLVRLSGFYEEESGVPYPVDAKAYSGGMMASSAPVAPSLPTGENTISTAVNLTYEIE